MDKNWKILEGVLAATITQAVNQAVEVSVGNAVSRTLVPVRTQFTAIKQPDNALAQVQPGNQYIGNSVSIQPPNTLTHIASRQRNY